MEYIISEVEEREFVISETVQNIKGIFQDHEGFTFIKHPLFNLNNVEPPSLYIVSRFFGSIIMDIYDIDIDNINDIRGSTWIFSNWDLSERDLFEDGEDKLSSLYSKIVANRELRKFSENDHRLKGKYILYLPNISRSLWEDTFAELFEDQIIFSNELSTYLRKLEREYNQKIPDDIWNILIGILTGTNSLIRPMRKAESDNTKASMLRKVEGQLQSLDFDLEQIKVAQQIPPGPQRIRGLAGTGKTVVLAMKVAFMHIRHPEWTIVYTFNTQSLYNHINDLIKGFYKHFTDGREPDWNKILILHGWGGKKRGLYSYIAQIVGIRPKTFSEARNSYEYKRNSELLGSCCSELMQSGMPKLFDAIIIDEAQDFNKNFFKFCYAILNEPKRLIWAYDELQSLEDVNIPTAKDIFGVDKNNIPLVDLDGVYSGGIEKDFILFKAYRNPRIVLTTAHVFGMGLLRKDGPIQFLPKKEAWEDLGYSVEGTFDIGKKVTITRPLKNSPNVIEQFSSPGELIRVKAFESKEDELSWIAENIDKDIKAQKLRPEDILVIGFPESSSSRDLYKNFEFLQSLLIGRGINSFVIGKDVDRDIFRVPNSVTLSTVFKAKGNESAAVYIFNFENSELKDKIIQSRNMAFTSITRTKGWCSITGSGQVMNELERELNIIISQYPKISFEIPDMAKIKRYLDNVDYEKRRARIKKTEKALLDVVKKVKELKGEDELSPETKREIIELAGKFKA